MPDLKYLYRVLYILINCFFKQIVDISFNKDYYQESNILIIAYNRVATVAEWLDGSFESQSSPAVVRYPEVPKYAYHVFKLSKRLKFIYSRTKE